MHDARHATLAEVLAAYHLGDGRELDGGEREALLALLEALTEAYAEFISKQPGFIAAGLHVNDAQTRIANYSQWARREDFQAMLRMPEMRRRNRAINDLCKSFEPVMYEVAATFG